MGIGFSTNQVASRMPKAVLLLALLLVVLMGCSRALNPLDPGKDIHDPQQGLTREDYRHMHKGENEKNGSDGAVTSIEKNAPPIPSLSQILAIPKPPKIGHSKLVSIAVTDDVPLKDVLIELSRLADVDVELDAGVSGGISFTAKNRPFNQVIARIADLANLRYSMKEGVLRIERDLPYIKNYSLDFLNISRDTESTVNISTNVLSAGGDSGGGSGLNTGSTSSITSTAESDFWAGLESGIQEILNYAPAGRMSKVATTADASSAAANVAAAAANAGTGGAGGGSAGVNNETTATADTSTTTTGAAAATTNDRGTVGHSTALADAFYIINRQAGLLTVSGNDKQHQLVETFIGKMRDNASAQVLIEAKILEVTLNDEYNSGVQWDVLQRMATDGTKTGHINLNYPGTIDANNSTAIRLPGMDLNDLIKLSEEFGTIKTLSSPRLHAMNNQQAVLTFAENRVYFDLTINRESSTVTTGAATPTFYTVESEAKTVPIGIILSIQPTINRETSEVTLNVRPTLSRYVRGQEDPAVAFLASQSQGSLSGISNEVPVVEVRELDSILKLKSGQVMVIGGLMEEVNSNSDTGLPGVSEVPVLGNLFKSVNKTTTKKELVIFIRATIVGSDGNADEADRNVYNKMSNDPRPLDF